VAAVALTVTATDVATARSLRVQVITLPLVVQTAPVDDALPGVKPAASRKVNWVADATSGPALRTLRV
jgi:hypothetical protein